MSFEEYYIGQDRYAHTEFHAFETEADLVEWVAVRKDRYDLDMIRKWDGPGSMISVLLVFVRYDREQAEEAGYTS